MNDAYKMVTANPETVELMEKAKEGLYREPNSEAIPTVTKEKLIEWIRVCIEL